MTVDRQRSVSDDNVVDRPLLDALARDCTIETEPRPLCCSPGRLMCVSAGTWPNGSSPLAMPWGLASSQSSVPSARGGRE